MEVKYTDHEELRAEIAKALRESFDYHIVAEWICCYPVDPAHELCVMADTVRRSVIEVLSDDSGLWPGESPVINTITDLVMKRLNEKDQQLYGLRGLLHEVKFVVAGVQEP